MLVWRFAIHGSRTLRILDFGVCGFGFRDEGFMTGRGCCSVFIVTCHNSM